MIVYRLSKCQYASDLSGKGAEKYGGRWNSKGTGIIYTSSSRALAVAEIAVHTPLGILPENYCLATLNLPEQSIKILDLNLLPSNWNQIPFLKKTQSIGDHFAREKKYLVLQVPSAVVSGDFNYLVNPLHKDFIKIELNAVESFEFDSRLFVK